MKRKLRLREYRLNMYLVSFFSFVLSMHFIYSAYAVQTAKNVLFISSYTERFITVPDHIEGIKSVFKSNNIKLDIEYMDAKRFDTDENKFLFYQLLKYKMERLNSYDAVIVGDDSALEFVTEYKDSLFKELPIIFFGINDFRRATYAYKFWNITGLIEAISLKETIEIAQKFNKNASKVVAIVDNTITGIGDTEQFYNSRSSFEDLSFQDINVSNYTFKEFGEVLETIEKDTILLYLSMFMDKTGAVIEVDEAVKILSEHAKVPVYRASIGGVGQGVLGGKMVSYFEQGKMAANLVLDIFKGTPVHSIKMITESPNKYIFDYKIIKKYGIDMSLIPDEAIIINKDLSFFEQNRNIARITIAIIIFLLFVVFITIRDNLRRRAIEKQIKQNNEELTALYEELAASDEELRDQYKEIQHYTEKVEFLAYHDSLTNLPNRMNFMEKLAIALNRGEKGAVMLLDLDNFKSINDILGHTYGDLVIKEVSEKFVALSDENMFISRFGGDEFLILISDEDSFEKIEEYATKVSNVFTRPLILKNEEIYISYSMGITRYPFDSSDANQLIMNADAAMYRVKNSGKSNYMFFDNDMIREFKEKVRIEGALREALKTEAFTFLYQPQVKVKTGEIVGFEALLRLRDYNIGPNIFIPVAEETGLITEMGKWAVREAISQLAEWKEKGYELKPIAVNFSAKQLKDDKFLSFLEKSLKEKAVEAKYLEIEVTESVLLERTEDTIQFLKKLKGMGVKIALDDFGTGYSSLSYLTYMPVDKIKLDKSLNDKFLEIENVKVMDSLISLAHSLNLEVTAEGIEKVEQYKRLKIGGCDYFQGYLFSKPLKAEDVEKIYNNVFLV
jgi:diguanylate cyclase (GGDEF)-like protein